MNDVGIFKTNDGHGGLVVKKQNINSFNDVDYEIVRRKPKLNIMSRTRYLKEMPTHLPIYTRKKKLNINSNLTPMLNFAFLQA